MTEFFTLDWLLTVPLTVAAVALMVQVCKFLIPVFINPKLLCLIWAVIFSVVRVLWIVPATTPAAWFEMFINVLLIAVAATGTFEFAIKPLERKALEAREAAQQAGTTTDNAGDGDGQ